MSVRTLCDACKKPVPGMYIHVENGGYVQTDCSVPEKGLDFCDATCLAKWAMSRATVTDERWRVWGEGYKAGLSSPTTPNPYNPYPYLEEGEGGDE